MDGRGMREVLAELWRVRPADRLDLDRAAVPWTFFRTAIRRFDDHGMYGKSDP